MSFGLKHTLREVVVVLITNITLRRGDVCTKNHSFYCLMAVLMSAVEEGFFLLANVWWGVEHGVWWGVVIREKCLGI